MFPLAALAPYKTLAIAAVFAALVIGLFVQGERLAAAHATASAKDETITALRAQLNAQSAGLAALKEQTARTAAASIVASQAASKSLLESVARARKLETAPVPNDCAGAVRWGAEQAKELGAW